MDAQHNDAADAYEFGYSIGRIDAKSEILQAIIATNQPTLTIAELTAIINSIPN